MSDLAPSRGEHSDGFGRYSTLCRLLKHIGERKKTTPAREVAGHQRASCPRRPASHHGVRSRETVPCTWGCSDQEKLGALIQLKYHTIDDAASQLGTLQVIRDTFVGFQRYSYE